MAAVIHDVIARNAQSGWANLDDFELGKILDNRQGGCPMSKTLPFTQHLLAMGRNLERLGQTRAASRLLSRLASFGDLPKDVAEETNLHLAELHLQSGHFKKARRKLAAALTLQPDNARYHFLMAGAAEEDDTCDPRRALWHYRRCTKLAPGNPAYWCALGLCAIDQGEKEEGLDALRRAHESVPEDYEILSQVVQGLWDVAKQPRPRSCFGLPSFATRATSASASYGCSTNSSRSIPSNMEPNNPFSPPANV